MDLDEFWSLIEEAGRRARPGPVDGYMARYVARLTGMLRERSPEEVVAFSNHFDDRLRDAYNWDLWGAAYVIGQGLCSDDWFEYFRCWLISMGREVYEQALADPDSLVEPASRPEVEDVFFEDLLYVPGKVHEEMTGTEMPDYPNPPQSSGRAPGHQVPRRRLLPGGAIPQAVGPVRLGAAIARTTCKSSCLRTKTVVPVRLAAAITRPIDNGVPPGDAGAHGYR